MTKIGTGTFFFFIFLNKIVVDANNPKYDSHDNSNAIIDKDTHTIIVGCQYTPEIPDDITTIGPYAFAYSFIPGIAIKKNVTKIGYGAFEHCSLLKRVLNCQGLVTIGDYAFANIPDFGKGSTINLDIMTNLKTIGEGAYMESGASKAIIPASVEKVGDAAFGFMPNLTELQSMAVIPPTCSIFGPVSDEMYQTCKLYVPMGSEEAYKAADGWKNFFSIEAGINSIQTGAPFVTDSYSFNGQRTTDNHRGLTIQRTSDGRIRKVVIH